MDGRTGCADLLRSVDWSQNALGDPAFWPLELKTVVGIVLSAKQPMFVVWGPEQILIYNDGCAAVYGPHHPWVFGKPFRATLSNLWGQIEPYVTGAYQGVSAAGKDVEFTMTRHGYPERTFLSFSYTPVRSQAGDVLGMFCAFSETTGRVAVKREREREQGRLKSIFETALGSVAVTSGPGHRISFTNAEFDTMVGHRNVLGRTVEDALPEIVAQGFKALMDQVYATGVAHIGRGVHVSLQRQPGAPPEERVVDFLYHPISDRSGATEGIFVQALDVTDNHLLNHELAHRLKNQLTIVQAIINLSFRSASSIDEVRDVLTARVAVLARSHDAVLSGNEASAAIGDVVRNAVEWHDPRRIRINGPHVSIGARPALSLALMMHELLTNAVKHGALSSDNGFVTIDWKIVEGDGKPRLSLDWRETGGPMVTEPEKKGSGSRLIRSGLSGVANTCVTLVYAPEGFRCAVSADIAGLQSDR